MKKRIFAAVMALCLMAGSSAFAQEKKGDMPRQQWTPEQIAQKKTEQMTQHLNLTQDQAKQVYNYNLEQVKQMQAKREDMRSDRKAEAEQMKAVLTPEQYQKWAEMQKERMHDKKGMMSKEGKKACCEDGKGDKPAPAKEKK